MSDLFVSWLLAERSRYRERAGNPTLVDLREYGVTRREIREYLRATGWSCDARDSGDCPTRGQWQDGPPTWSHHTYLGTLDLRHDDATILAIADREGRSPWDVLDDASLFGDERTIYADDDSPIATIRGPQIRRACDGAVFRVCDCARA